MPMMFQIVPDLITAWRVRHGHKDLRQALPPALGPPKLAGDLLHQRVRRIRIIVAGLLFFKPGRCFYRAFAMAAMLRREGVAAIINIGCRQCHHDIQPFAGHCWVSLGDAPIGEINDAFKKYPLKIGTDPNLIQYWLGES